MTRPQTPADVLRAAADYIVQHGWCQQTFERRGSVCAMGAIRVVVCADPDPLWGDVGLEQRVQEAREAFIRQIAWPEGVVDWNDQPDRTASEVIAALRRAAERAEEKTNG